MGEPQGTILGTIMVVLYVKVLLNEIQESCIMSQAENTVILSTTEDTWNQTVNKMNSLLQAIAD